MRNPIFLMLGVFASAAVMTAAEPVKRPPNILFIMADDMKPALGCYGGEALTPNLDQLAAKGVRFDRAYCQYPLCNPSRTSLLTGQYPTTSGVLDNTLHFRDTQPELVTLPQYFRQQGYTTLRFGKIFHNSNDDTPSWTEGADLAPGQPRPEKKKRAPADYQKNSDRCVVLEGNGEKHADYTNTDKVIAALPRLKAADAPFFIAMGYTQPHSPPTAPQRFLDLYPRDQVKLPPDFGPRPAALPGFPVDSVGPNYDLFINRDATADEARAVKATYLAACSWVDWNVGRLLAALDAEGLRENTIILFWGDHGYHLGEKGKWSKHGSLYELGLRVPLIISAPGQAGNGQTSPRIVETLDLFPTLAELSRLPIPAHAEGHSLAPLLAAPTTADWDFPAYAFHRHEKKLQRAVRHGRWLYAEYDAPPVDAMLIDVENDPSELTNLLNDPAHAETVAQMKALLARLPVRNKP